MASKLISTPRRSGLGNSRPRIASAAHFDDGWRCILSVPANGGIPVHREGHNLTHESGQKAKANLLHRCTETTERVLD